MAYTVTHTVEVEVITCADCGSPFGIEANMIKGLRKSHETFYCPKGHRNYYGESKEEKEIKKLKETLQAETERSEWWKHEAETKAKQLSATKGQLTKTKNRLAGGVCPCCNRQFINLARHMAGQHPDYSKHED